MTAPARQFAYLPRDPNLGLASLAPMLPLTLAGDKSIPVYALVDSGAAVNVLPFSIGMQLGLDWDRQTTSVELSGNLAAIPARVIVVSATFADFAPVRLAFAWAKTDAVPAMLGQVNFFLEFDVCFFRSRSMFELRPRQTS